VEATSQKIGEAKNKCLIFKVKNSKEQHVKIIAKANL
jgi:hypothetical protein